MQTASTTPDESRAAWLRAALVLGAVALGVRLILVFVMSQLMRGIEFGDDFSYYEAMVANPLLLVTGIGSEALGEAAIYAPLVPVQLFLVCKPFIAVFGLSTGQRLGMVLCDVVALTITFAAAFRYLGAPRSRAGWIVALLFALVPGSLMASAVWGQEDTITAFWASVILVLILDRRYLAATIIAGLGLFTIKIFAALIILGIWIGVPEQRRRIVLTAIGTFAVFGLFLLLRWMISGMLYRDYNYRGIDNSASPWAFYHLMIGRLEFEQIRPMIIGVTLAALSLLTLACWRNPPPPVQSIIAVHALFMVVFIGAQPEHHQWFMPFLIYAAWQAMRRADWVLVIAAWLFSALAYGYKITYGLRGNSGVGSPGKAVFREWFANNLGFDLFGIQIALLLLTLACGFLIVLKMLRRNPEPQNLV